MAGAETVELIDGVIALDHRARAGLTVTGASADSQIRLTVRHLLEAGATSQEIAETLAVAGLFIRDTLYQAALQYDLVVVGGQQVQRAGYPFGCTKKLQIERHKRPNGVQYA